MSFCVRAQEKSALVRENLKLRQQVAQLMQETRRAVADKQQLAREQVSTFFMERLLEQNKRLMIGQSSAPHHPGRPHSNADTTPVRESVASCTQEEEGRIVPSSSQEERGRSDKKKEPTTIT
jgi:hypothetical protein